MINFHDCFSSMFDFTSWHQAALHERRSASLIKQIQKKKKDNVKSVATNLKMCDSDFEDDSLS